MKQYKAVPGPMNVHVDKGDRQAAFNLFADIINNQAAQGWTYHSMETITITEKQGCALPSATPPAGVNHYMLIFEKDI